MLCTTILTDGEKSIAYKNKKKNSPQHHHYLHSYFVHLFFLWFPEKKKQNKTIPITVPTNL